MFFSSTQIQKIDLYNMNFINSSFKILSVLSIITLVVSACSNSGDKQAQKTSHASAGSASVPGETADKGQKLKDAPDFTLETMKGDNLTLSNQQGSVVVLNFWATWCAPCRKEIPGFMELHKELKDEGVLFAGVSLDEEGWGKVRPYAEDMGINYPIMVDDGKVTREYGPIRAIPTTFIINKKGQVEYVAPGMLTKDKLQPILEKLAAR